MKVNRNKSIKLPKLLFQACLITAIMAFAYPRTPFFQEKETPSENIKIGLLIPDDKSIASVHGAEIAVRFANEKGGLNGRHFQLVVRSMEGPWGTGSKQAIDLIFEEKVWALLGSHDGRNAHLVEQAATKSQVVFVSAWSGDPTLSQAFVPWFFNCVPNDNQQATSLIDEIFNKRKFGKIAVVHGNDYDSKMSLNNFLKSLKISGKIDPVQFNYDDYTQKLNILSNEITETDADCILLFCQPSASTELVQQFWQNKMIKPIFGSIMLLNENELSDQELKSFDNLLSIPSGDWSGSENLAFRQEFQKTYGRIPGMVASYSFDGMKILIEAVKNAGAPDREKIQKSLEKIHYEGVTGLIQFDERGNRKGNFEIMKTKYGVPVIWENEIPR